MTLSIGFLKELLAQYGLPLIPAELKKRMTKAIPKIVAGMVSKGVTPQTASGRVVVRDALFRLWKAVVKSGDIADLLRDAQDDKVLAIVLPQIAGEGTTETTKFVVEKTLDALIEVTF